MTITAISLNCFPKAKTNRSLAVRAPVDRGWSPPGEISPVLALIENSGFGSRHAAPAARALYDVYFEKMRRGEEVLEQIAQNPQ
jgi:hypothetical protein